MKYFFLIYSLLLLLVLLFLPNRYGKFAQTEWRIFPDMDEQDKLLGQRESHFFSDNRGARIPDKNLVPMGFQPLTEKNRNTLPEFGFTNGTGYVFTGKQGEEYGSGLPKELDVESLNDARQLLAHGEERYKINCSACHGLSADGEGPVKARGFTAIPPLNSGNALDLKDGNIFQIITDGRGLMGSFKHNTSIKDRWAIVAYLRALQEAKKATAKAK